MKKVVIISSSLRKDSNSERLAEAFARGATDAKHQVEFVSLIGKQIGFCIGCLSCLATKKCVIKDDALAIAESVKAADVVVLATPVYYYEMSGQLKTVLDRCNPIFSTDYKFRDVYLLTAAAENDPQAMDGTTNGVQGWIDCFPKARFAGEVRGIGLEDPGDANLRQDLLQQAYNLGQNI